jgi:ATP-dependent DNA helicase RecQ
MAAAAETHRADQSHDGGEVRRIETMHGTIVTTSPETLPQTAEASEFARGTAVRHKLFGEGKVKDGYGDMALVHFAKVGGKKVKVSFLDVA